MSRRKGRSKGPPSNPQDSKPQELLDKYNRAELRSLSRRALADIFVGLSPKQSQKIQQRVGRILETSTTEIEALSSPVDRAEALRRLASTLKHMAEVQSLANRNPVHRMRQAIRERFRLEQLGASLPNMLDPKTATLEASRALHMSMAMAIYDGDVAGLATIAEKLISTLPEQRAYKHDLSGDLASLLSKGKPPSQPGQDGDGPVGGKGKPGG